MGTGHYIWAHLGRRARFLSRYSLSTSCAPHDNAHAWPQQSSRPLSGRSSDPLLRNSVPLNQGPPFAGQDSWHVRRSAAQANVQQACAIPAAASAAAAAPADIAADSDGKAFPSSDKVSEKARVVFETCWRRLEQRYEQYQCPHEIVWLNGAPGAGKGANTQFILQSRGLSRAVPMSDMLERHPEIKSLMDRGELVPDTLVGDALLDIIFDPAESDDVGLLIDGFPRTALQVDFLKLLFDKMMQLHLRYADTPDEWRFPRPSFKVVVLYVEQEESVRRQMFRAQLAERHNKRAADAGSEDIWLLRSTDIDAAKCRRRYEVFKAHYNTVLRLKQFFPFSLIDAMGSLEDTRAQIMRELRYQSSLDLEERTYASIRHLPLAADLVKASRQQLVHRLDTYCKRHSKVFAEVVRVIDNEAVPLLRRCSLAGHAELKTRNRLFRDHPLAVDMFVDVLSDRGFSVAHVVDEFHVPLRVDRETGELHSRVEEVHHFRITFEKEGVREAAMRAAQASSDIAATAQRIAIGQTYIPSHMDREARRAIRAVPVQDPIRPQATVVAGGVVEAMPSAAQPLNNVPERPAPMGPAAALHQQQHCMRAVGGSEPEQEQRTQPG